MLETRLESLAVEGINALSQRRSSQNRTNAAHATAVISPVMDRIALPESGRIILPGFPPGSPESSLHEMSPESVVRDYLPLVHLQARTLEANRILDRYRNALRLGDLRQHENLHLDQFNQFNQEALTALTPSETTPHLFYKREDRTVTRAYKVRGAVVGMAKAMETGLARRFSAVSTGNHALGILKAAQLLRPDEVRMIVPCNIADHKLVKIEKAIDTLQTLGVEAVLEKYGYTFIEARQWAQVQIEREQMMRETSPATQAKTWYLDPYDDPWVVAGNGTIGVELLRQVAALLSVGHYEEVLVISPIGGGGLLTGTATALTLLSAWEPAFANIRLRFIGLRLSDPDSLLGDAIRVPEMAPANRTALESLRVQILSMADEEMQAGIRFVADDLGVDVEGASGGTLSPVLSREDCQPSPQRLVICLLSGANRLT